MSQQIHTQWNQIALLCYMSGEKTLLITPSRPLLWMNHFLSGDGKCFKSIRDCCSMNSIVIRISNAPSIWILSISRFNFASLVQLMKSFAIDFAGDNCKFCIVKKIWILLRYPLGFRITTWNNPLFYSINTIGCYLNSWCDETISF